LIVPNVTTTSQSMSVEERYRYINLVLNLVCDDEYCGNEKTHKHGFLCDESCTWCEYLEDYY
jgi:hypothetical protein